MMISHCLIGFSVIVTVLATPSVPTHNVTFTNPMIRGSFPDPSCIFLPDYFDGTFLCASSSFLSFPGIPLHASKDLVNWRLVGHAFNRREQHPSFASITNQQFGVYAPTLRRKNDTFFLTTTVFGRPTPPYITNLVFNATDPFDDSSWGLPLVTGGQTYDNSLFWDMNGTIYSQGSTGFGISQCLHAEVDEIQNCALIWNGTGGASPEGPHMYQKDGFHYLIIAEGGSGLTGPTAHHETAARSRNIGGPYEPDPHNPVLSNVNSSEYFTGAGHVDLFQDGNNNWWGVALATRSGSEFTTYPMGRETVLFAVTWESGRWPVFSQVRGLMTGPLPRLQEAPGDGPLQNSPDIVDFELDSNLPRNFAFWKFPNETSYQISPQGHERSLRLTPSFLNLTGDMVNASEHSRTFVSRRQTDTLFTYSVDVEFSAQHVEEEVGVSLFNTQDQHVDLGLVMLSNGPHLRFRANHATNISVDEILRPVGKDWLSTPVRFEIRAINTTHFSFFAGLVLERSEVVLHRVTSTPGAVVSGGYTGSFVGTYATNNGGVGETDAFVRRWRYLPQGQYLGDDEWVFPELYAS